MATHTWTGAVSGNYGTAGNWAGGTPVGGGDVIIDATSVNIDDGLDQSAVDLASFYVGPNYTGQIGNSDTAPLIIEATLVTVDGGGANGYLGVQDSDVVKIFAVGPTGTGNLTITATTCPLLVVNQGIVKLFSGTVTLATLSAFNGVQGNAALNVLNGTITTLKSGPGTASILEASASGVITTADVNGGVLDIVASAGTLTNLNAYGGTTKWGAEDNNMTVANLFAGSSFIVKSSPVARTIVTLNSHVGSTRTINDPAEALTITNNNDFGGTETDPTDD